MGWDAARFVRAACSGPGLRPFEGLANATRCSSQPRMRLCWAAQGNAAQMLEDINTSIAWVQDAIPKWQGDSDNITLVGQSAGGHLACLALFKQVRCAARRGSGSQEQLPAWGRLVRWS